MLQKASSWRLAKQKEGHHFYRFTFNLSLCTFALSLGAKTIIYDQIDDRIRENRIRSRK
jgi:hypothetical protein